MANSVIVNFPRQFQYYLRAMPRLTMVPIVVLLFVIFVLIPFYWVQHAELDVLKKQLIQSEQAPHTNIHQQTVETAENQISGFYAHIPKESGINQLIDHFLRIVSGYGVEYGGIDYRLLPIANSRLLTLEILMPLKGSYRDIRQMMIAVLNAMPSLAVTEVHFERESAQTSQVNAKLSFRVYLLHE